MSYSVVVYGVILKKTTNWCYKFKKNIVNFILFLLLGLFIQYFTGVEAKAQGNLHVGSLRLNPIFSTSESYDDNIFDVPKNKDTDFITTLSPGINLSSPIKVIKSEASIGYLANILEYTNHTDQSHVNQYIDGSFKTLFPYGLGITFRDRFENTEQPPTFDLIYGQLVQRIKRHSNDFSATVALPEYFGRLEPEIYYSNYDIQYDDSTVINDQGTSTAFIGKDSSFNTNKIGTRLTYKLFTQLNVLTEFNVGKTNYETNVIGDSKFFETLFGVQFKETAKTTGIFKVGYLMRSYENDMFDPFKGVVLSYESRTQLTASTFLSVLLRRSQEESLVVNTNNIRNFYELNSIYLTIGRQLTSKIDASFTNYYQLLDFPKVNSDASTANNSNIKVFTYGFRPAINYKIQKWLFANFSYWYDNRSSDDNSNNTSASGWEKGVTTFTIGATF